MVLLSLLCLGACPACAGQGELCRAHTIFTSCIGYNKHVYAEETYFDYFSFNLWSMSEAWEQEDPKIKIEYSGIISRWNEESVNYQLRPIPWNSVCQLTSQACSDGISVTRNQSILMLQETHSHHQCIVALTLHKHINKLGYFTNYTAFLNSEIEWQKSSTFKIHTLKCMMLCSIGAR